MKASFVTPFVNGSTRVLDQLVGVPIERGQLAARPQMFTSQQINIMCGLTGQIQGQVIYGMSVLTSVKIASKMSGMEINGFDELVASAIAELGNMISGNSVTLLSEEGYVCDITPPTIIKGSNVRISSLDIPALVIPLKLEGIGNLDVNVSLQERAAKVAA